MTMAANIFENIPDNLPAELFETLQSGTGVTIERIVSRGHRSAQGFWYDQDRNEWVLLLRGGAALTFADRTDPIVLKPGDYLHIPVHARHRVEWTDPNAATVWLAIYY